MFVSFNPVLVLYTPTRARAGSRSFIKTGCDTYRGMTGKMANRSNLRLQLGRWWVPIPRFIWRRILTREARETRRWVNSLGVDYHRVRDFVVVEIPKVGRPLPASTIAKRLDMTLADVEQILEELESQKTFLFRNQEGEVEWAYPITSCPTPHRATFSSGERTWAA